MIQRPPITVRPATTADRPVIADILARAFIDDPALSHIYPAVATRPKRLRGFFDLITAIEPDLTLTNIALDPTGRPVAVALWRSPGNWETPPTTMLRNVIGLVRAFGTALPRALTVQAALDAHHPSAPHWYLSFAGCIPEAQGKGYGGAAIRARLALCDAAGLPAALETATESNTHLYRALGFAESEVFDVPKGPHFWSMWRTPR